MITKGPISQFIETHYLHFNAAALVDAAKGYEAQLHSGSKMLVSLAGAMSTAEIGISFAEMIRQDKVQIISCTGANLEEDIMNLVAHSHYKRIPNYRDLTPQDEWDLLEKGLNRVTDPCIPEEEAFRRLEKHGKMPKVNQRGFSLTSICINCYCLEFWNNIMKLISKILGCMLLHKKTSPLFVQAGKTVQWEIFLLVMFLKVNSMQIP